jgi:hypothetical protein
MLIVMVQIRPGEWVGKYTHDGITDFYFGDSPEAVRKEFEDAEQRNWLPPPDTSGNG